MGGEVVGGVGEDSLMVCVTRWWTGLDIATLTASDLSHTSCAEKAPTHTSRVERRDASPIEKTTFSCYLFSER